MKGASGRLLLLALDNQTRLRGVSAYQSEEQVLFHYLNLQTRWPHDRRVSHLLPLVPIHGAGNCRVKHASEVEESPLSVHPRLEVILLLLLVIVLDRKNRVGEESGEIVSFTEGHPEEAQPRQGPPVPRPVDWLRGELRLMGALSVLWPRQRGACCLARNKAQTGIREGVQDAGSECRMISMVVREKPSTHRPSSISVKRELCGARRRGG